MALTQERWVSNDHGGPTTASITAAVPVVATEAQPGLVLLLLLPWLPPLLLPEGAVSWR